MADTSSAATEKKVGSTDDDTIQAVNLLAQGKRNLVVGDMVEAVGQLQEACRLLAGKFGETADECAEAYLAYGKALLDLARMESGVLGNALQGIDSDEESEEKSTTSDEKVDESDKMTAEEKEKLSDEIIEAMAEREEEKRATGEKKSGKEGEGNGTVVNGSGNKEEEGDEKMDAEKTDAEKMETEEVKDDKTKVEKKTEESAKEPASDDKIEKDEKTDDKDEKEEKKEDNAGVDGNNGEIESKAAGDKAEGDEDKIRNGKETVEKEKETEKANEEIVEKAAGDKEDKKDEEMECEDGKDEEDEGDESSVKEGDTEEEEAESEDIADEEGEKEGEEKDGEKEGEKEAGDSKEEPDDDVSNLQLAWEVLELARTIYKKHDPKDMKLKLAETHLKLGEVGLETEQYDQAILDFKECLTIQKEYLEAEDRLLAETYYQLGLAYTFDKQYDPAIENFKSAASVIEAKIAKLKKILEDGEKEGKGKDLVDFDDPVYKARKEVAELEEILPDIMGKLEDVEDEKKNADRVKAAVMENVAMDFGTTTTGFGATTSAAPETAAKEVTNITHLVRKKRKPEDETIKEEDATKKLKTVEEGAGDASTKVNGKVNGTKTSPEKAMEADKKTKTVEDVKKTTEAAQTS